MKTYVIAFFLCLLAPATMAQNGDSPMPKTWFSSHDYTSVEVKRFDYAVDKSAPQKIVQFDDQEAIKHIIRRIENIPADGPEMRSFVPKEIVELTFNAAQDKQVIRIFDGHFKTPSTGFNTTKEAEKIEADIYQDMRSLLEPKLNQTLPRIAGHEYNLPGFTIKYEGREFFGDQQVSVSGQRDLFVIKSPTEEQKIKITSGQLPAKPYAFTVDNKSYILQTYRTGKGQDLPAYSFRVEDAPSK